MNDAIKEQGRAWNPEILENRVLMLLPVTFNSASKLDQFACRQLDEFIQKKIKSIPAGDLSEKIAARFPSMGTPKTNQLWEDLPGDATEDFHPFIQQIASIPKDSQTTDIRFARPLQMAQEDLISQVKGGKPRYFQLKLGQAAAKRCGKNFLLFQFLAPSLYGFASGTAILVLEWQYLGGKNAKVFASDIIEGNYAISHPPRNRSKPNADVSHISDGSDSEVAFEVLDFMTLAMSLLPHELSENISSGRRILYTALRIAPSDSPTAEADLSLLAHRIAHRQTFDYRPAPERITLGQLRPFANVRHTATIEGGCTLVEADNSAPEALKGLIRDRIRNTYLPLVLVSYHAYFWLLNQTQALPHSSASNSRHRELEHLETLQERALNFRRIFHFTSASQISQHNEFHALWQDALMIDQQLEALAALSEAAYSMVQEKRVRVFGYLSGGVGGLLLGKELIDIIRDKVTTNLYEWQRMLLEASTNPDEALLQRINETVHQAELWEWITIYGAGAGLVLGALAAWRFGLKSGH